MSLTENILMDLKMATENTLMAMTAPPGGSQEVVGLETLGSSAPVQEHEVEQIPDEDFYKQVLQSAEGSNKSGETSTAAPDASESSAAAASSASFGQTGSRVDANYEAMTLKELKSLARQRGIAVATLTHKKDFIEALKRQGSSSGSEPLAGTLGNGGLLAADEGFPVELGSSGPAESRTAE